MNKLFAVASAAIIAAAVVSQGKGFPFPHEMFVRAGETAGNVKLVQSSDDNLLTLVPSDSASSDRVDAGTVKAEFVGQMVSTKSDMLVLTIEDAVWSGAPVLRTVHFYNYKTRKWQLIDEMKREGDLEEVTQAAIKGGAFVNPRNGEVRAHITWEPTDDQLKAVAVDSISWAVN